jgi:hypothetical protein
MKSTVSRRGGGLQACGAVLQCLPALYAQTEDPKPYDGVRAFDRLKGKWPLSG